MAVHLYLRVFECIFKEEKDNQNKRPFDASCRPNGWVTSLKCISHLTYPNRHYLCEGVVSRMHELRHIWRRVSRANETCHIIMRHVAYEWGMPYHAWMRHVAHEWAMAHIIEACRIWMSHVTGRVWMCHGAYECAMWHMNESYAWAMWHENESCHTWHMDESCHI